ncbi:MAG: helix-turn-helix transcriptional regulator [Eubacteriales bacterium]|nr:helix-turn-helix transcriptional regulator [Eubacteriales bacterium]
MGNKIKAYRRQRKMTQAELSVISGVSRTTISGLESGRIMNTTAETLVKIAKALGGSISDIFFAA